MKKKTAIGPGRPKMPARKAFTNRHVVNISDEQQEALNRFCEQTGFSRQTDGMRALMVKALKAEGLL